MKHAADGVNGGEPERQEIIRGRGQQLTDANSYIYSARQVSATRPAMDDTARVIPQHDGVAVPVEAAQILWQQCLDFEIVAYVHPFWRL